MAEIELGPEPHRLTVPLFPGLPYWSQIRVDPPLEPTESVDLVFADNTTWPGVINDDRDSVTFVSGTADAVDARLAADDRSCWLRLTDEHGALPWAVGQVVRGKAT